MPTTAISGRSLELIPETFTSFRSSRALTMILSDAANARIVSALVESCGASLFKAAIAATIPAAIPARISRLPTIPSLEIPLICFSARDKISSDPARLRSVVLILVAFLRLSPAANLESATESAPTMTAKAPIAPTAPHISPVSSIVRTATEPARIAMASARILMPSARFLNPLEDVLVPNILSLKPLIVCLKESRTPEALLSGALKKKKPVAKV